MYQVFLRVLTNIKQQSLSLITLIALLQACSSTNLQSWHKERIESEFEAGDPRVHSLEDYLAVEKQTFAELDTLLTSDERLINRYSRGSLSDPTSRTHNWNRSFELSNDKPAGYVLLLHGMSDSPYSLREVAQSLSNNGFHVLGLRLPGHGTIPSGLRYLHADDMLAATDIGMSYLSKLAGDKPLHIVGYSTGATLALNYTLRAANNDELSGPASLVLISPAIRIHSAAAMAGFLTGLSSAPGLSDMAWLDVMPEFDPYKYNSFPANAANVVRKLTLDTNKRLNNAVSANTTRALPPVLVLKSTVDATVTTEAVVDDLMLKLKQDDNELVLFDLNRNAVIAELMVNDPGPLTRRLANNDSLPFTLRMLKNSSANTNAVEVRVKPPFTQGFTDSQPLNMEWPNGVISLSHVALPFPPDDELYGATNPKNPKHIFLGRSALKGERGLSVIPGDYQLRMRYNPFYSYMETSITEWLMRNSSKQSD